MKLMAAAKKKLSLLEEEKLLKKEGNFLFSLKKFIKVIWRKTQIASLQEKVSQTQNCLFLLHRYFRCFLSSSSRIKV